MAKNTLRSPAMAKKAKSKTRRPTRGKSNEDALVVVHGVQYGQLSPKLFLGDLRAVKDGKAAREWLGLTLKDLGIALAQTCEAHRDEPYSKQYISQLENGNKPYLPDLRLAIARLKTDRIYRFTGETIGVSIRINSPWHIDLWRFCETHGRYKLKRVNQKNCPKCRK
jgi:transcriptional regulator with XRE-family HTH domain